jgi:hypothetical protein
VRKADIRYNIVGITSNILNTYQMNPTAWVSRIPLNKNSADLQGLERQGWLLLGRYVLDGTRLGIL